MKIPEHLWWIAGAFAWLGILAFGVLWWLSGIASIIPGAHDYTTRLPNGYFLTRQWSGSLSIYEDRDENRVVDPATEVGPSQYGILMAVTGRYIVGNLDTEEAAYKVPEGPDRYFIIAMRAPCFCCASVGKRPRAPGRWAATGNQCGPGSSCLPGWDAG